MLSIKSIVKTVQRRLPSYGMILIILSGEYSTAQLVSSRTLLVAHAIVLGTTFALLHS